MEFHATVHEEDGSYWAEVQELPGCFASGRDLNELQEALIEAIGMCLTQNEQAQLLAETDKGVSPMPIGGAVTVGKGAALPEPGSLRVGGITVATERLVPA